MATSKRTARVSTLCMLTMQSRQLPSIAVVGGGITGSCAANELSKHFPNVVVFDQGQRGPGGRASHRSINSSDGKVLPDDEIPDLSDTTTFQFDHGCQFFRADSSKMQTELLQEWCSNGWAAPWNGRFGSLGGTEKGTDFFGLPSRTEKVYIGMGGMHKLPRQILDHSKATVHRGTRVTKIKKNGLGKWDVYGVAGKAAYHDTAEAEARKAEEGLLQSFDAVVFTDVSSSFSSWHRASAGIPDSFLDSLPKRTRIPLFSCLVALSHPIGDIVGLDGFTVSGQSKLWFAARSQSKPGFPKCNAESWTLISTPSYAVDQIRETNMRDPNTGEFRPQGNDYLNSVPGPELFDAFLEAIKPNLEREGTDLPNAVYMQAQRWGSALPCPDILTDNVEEICGTTYAARTKSSLVYERPQGIANDFVADDQLSLYYAGDFFSQRNPGFESAALSGLDVAKHIIEKLK